MANLYEYDVCLEALQRIAAIGECSDEVHVRIMARIANDTLQDISNRARIQRDIIREGLNPPGPARL